MGNSLTVHDASVWHQRPELPLKGLVSKHILQSKLREDFKASILPTFQTLLCFPPEGLRPQELDSPAQFPTGCQHEWLPMINGGWGGQAGGNHLLLLTALLCQPNPASRGSGFHRYHQRPAVGQEKTQVEQFCQSASLSKGDLDATVLLEES